MVGKLLRACAVPSIILLSLVLQVSAQDTVRIRGTVERMSLWSRSAKDRKSS
jgi:hypothetical protein